MSLVGFFKQTLKEFGNDKVSQLSAAFSYGAIFSLAPLLLVLISIIGFIYGDKASQGKLFSELNGTVGPSTAKTIQTAVAHAHKASSGALALVLGTIGSLLGAAGLTSILQNALDTIFRVVPDPKSGIKRTIYVKLKNVFLVVVAGIFIAASLIASILISGFSKKISNDIGLPPAVVELINELISLVIFILMLYFAYTTLADVKIPRKLALSASACVAILFLIGKFVLGIIIGRNSTASAYGAAASIISLLLWLYYSSQILYLGAEGIKVYADEHSIILNPKKLNIKRTTLTLDAPGLGGKLAEAWKRGFNKGMKS
jgi:membrane protein